VCHVVPDNKSVLLYCFSTNVSLIQKAEEDVVNFEFNGTKVEHPEMQTFSRWGKNLYFVPIVIFELSEKIHCCSTSFIYLP
jgi:hypothetical protein